MLLVQIQTRYPRQQVLIHLVAGLLEELSLLQTHLVVGLLEELNLPQTHLVVGLLLETHLGLIRMLPPAHLALVGVVVGMLLGQRVVQQQQVQIHLEEEVHQLLRQPLLEVLVLPPTRLTQVEVEMPLVPIVVRQQQVRIHLEEGTHQLPQIRLEEEEEEEEEEVPLQTHLEEVHQHLLPRVGEMFLDRTHLLEAEEEGVVVLNPTLLVVVEVVVVPTLLVVGEEVVVVLNPTLLVVVEVAVVPILLVVGEVVVVVVLNPTLLVVVEEVVEVVFSVWVVILKRVQEIGPVGRVVVEGLVQRRSDSSKRKKRICFL